MSHTPLPREPKAVTVTGYGGLRLNVWDYGGPGIPLLLAHCTGTFGRIWDPVVAELGDRFRVLAPDTRGQGNSEAPEEKPDYQWIHSARDLLEVAEHFKLPKGVGAVGHSAGGAHVGYAELESPGVFGKVMLIEAVVAEKAYFEGENALAVKVARRKNSFASLSAARERLVAKPPMSLWTDGSVAAYLRHAFDIDDEGVCFLKCPGTREAWFYELGGASDLFESLETLHFDACLVVGEKSYTIPWVKAQHEKLLAARLETVAGSGHFVPQEKPAEVARLIGQWFDK